MAARGPGTGTWPVRALGPAVQALMTGRHEPDESRDSRPDLWGAAAEMPPPTRQDRKRRLDYECTSFTVRGYTFRVRKAPTRDGRSMFAAFLPAISGDALKDKGRIIRGWRINLRTTSDLKELAEWLNPVIRGWMNYYGKFYRGANSLIITVFGEEEQPGDGCEHALELVDRAAVAAAFPAEHPPCLHLCHGVL